MTITEAFVLFFVACILMAVPFAWMIWRDLKNNPQLDTSEEGM